MNLINPKHFLAHSHDPSIQLFTLKNKNGITTQITNYGGRIISLYTPDKNGQFDDIVLGYESLHDYIHKPEVYFGAIIGRYGNRIAKGTFTLNGEIYELHRNSEHGENHLHGGYDGFQDKIWTVESHDSNTLCLSYLSKEMEGGFPGTVKVIIEYVLSKENTLEIKFSARTDKTTILNLTHHSYFNLTGKKDKDIRTHHLKINADHFTPIDQFMIPNGNITTVENTPFDFTSIKPILKHIQDPNPQIQIAKGYDHNMVLNEQGLKSAAYVVEIDSCRTLEVFTTEPGLQLYTGNHLQNIKGKHGNIYSPYTGFCLEPQHFPNSPNEPNFKTPILESEETYTSTILYKFGIKDS